MIYGIFSTNKQTNKQTKGLVFKLSFFCLACALLLFFGIGNCTGNVITSPPATTVVFQSAVQTGGTSGTDDSTGLTLTFDFDPTTLAADNITLTGATKGELSGTGTTRSLAISAITVANGGMVSVSIASPSGFTISGSPQTAVVYRAPWRDANWQYRIKIIVEASKVSADQSNFPVYVNLDDLPDDFFNHVKSDGSDIVVTSSDATTKLSRDLAFIDVPNKLGALWFKAPALSSLTNTSFYIYYGYASASEAKTYTATWDGNYAGVWHLTETTGNQHLDSTANANNSTVIKNVADQGIAASQVGGADSFSGADDVYVKIPDSASLQISSAITMDMWVYFADLSSPLLACILSKRYQGAPQGYYAQIGYTDAIEFKTVIATVTATLVSATLPSTGRYYHIVMTYDKDAVANNMKIYIDGVLDSQSTVTGALTTGTNDLFFGGMWKASSGTTVYGHNGSIDEVAISNIARSPDWIATEYNNQKSSTTFYTVNGEEIP